MKKHCHPSSRPWGDGGRRKVNNNELEQKEKGMSGNLRVVDGIEDSIHGRYVMIASGPRKIWRAIEDFAEGAVFKDLTRQGITIVTDRAKRDLREKVQGWTSFRQGYVATQPG